MNRGLTDALPILIGEADDTVADRLCFLLEENGARVSIETTGSRVLDLALNEKFGLLIIAVRLPILSGIDTLTFLREHGVKTPAIGLVDIADQTSPSSDERLSLDAGFACLLDRTLAIEDVQTALSVALKQEKREGDDSAHRKTSPRIPFFSKFGSWQRRD